MADPVIRLKRSAVAGKRPTLANVELGEVALNTYDGNLFTRQDTGGVGIGTTVTLLTPWQESYGAASISYSGDVNVTGVITASDGRLIAGVGISSEGTYIGSGVTAFNFVGGAVTSVTVPSAGISTIRLDFNGLTGIFAKTENKFSATEGQTSFSVDYEVGYVDVFLNGVRLNSDNFTATDGSTVGLTTAASGGDAVDIIVYEPQSSATPKRVVTNATATAGQTVFTIPSYDTGTNSMDVFLNGIKLDSAEFTETDGTTVTLAVGAALNDELQFISYESDNNFWSLNGSTLHRTSPSNPVAIGTDISAGDYLTVGQVGASGTSLFVHGGARITGILTIGTGSITLDGSKNQISGLSGGLTVGTGASIFSPSSNILTLGTNNSEALRINSSGRIGVGINPQRRFHVHESTSSDLIVQFSNETTGSSVSDGFQLQVMASDGSVEFNNRENSYTSFKTNTTERVRITPDGNVGINTVSPTSPNNRTRFIDISGGQGFNTASLVLTCGPSYSNPKWEFLTSSEGSSTRLQISNGSNSRLSIDSSGKVGVATAFPQAQFHTVTDGSTLSGLFFGNGLRSQHPSGSIVTIATHDGTDGKIEVSGNYPLRFHANSGERARILPSGGITFNGDTSTANALDDYEEGTWTPNIRENGSSTAWDTITAQSGYYVKIGQVVSFHFRIAYSAVATNVVTGFYGWISGLPYSANTSTASVGFFNMAFVNIGGSSTPYHGKLNGTVIMGYSNQDNTSPGPMRTSEYPAGAHEILASGFYYV